MAEGKKGFYASRGPRRRLLPRWLWALAPAAITLLTAGAARAWPQSSGGLLTSSEGLSESWSALYGQGLLIYERQKSGLEALKAELETLGSGYGELTNLCEQLSRSNADLSRHNSQIAGRMQERDEDLARAYGEIGRLEKLALRLVIAIVAMGAFILCGACAAYGFFIKRG